MEVSRDDLERRFREMSDEEIRLRLRSGDLTPLAVEAATSTLNSRGLALPALRGPGDASTYPDDGSADEDIDLVTVTEAKSAVDANIIRGFLESRGIFASVWHEHTPTVPWAFLPGTLPRVQVRSDQVTQARELLAAMKRGDLELTDDVEVESSGKQSDLEATRGVSPAPGLESSWSSGAVSPVAPDRKGVLSKIFVLIIGALLVFWLWTLFQTER
jgi:hypothetical protein